MKQSHLIELEDDILQHAVFPYLSMKDLDALQHTCKAFLQRKSIKEMFERYGLLKNVHFYCQKATRGEWQFPAWVTHGLKGFNNGMVRPKRIYSSEDVKRHLNHIHIHQLFEELKRTKVRVDYQFTEKGVIWKMHDKHLSTAYLRVIAAQKQSMH